MKNSTTKFYSSSLAKNMLLKCPLDGDKLQVLLQDKHPNCEIFGYMICPVCKSRLHGHGWRSRFCQDGSRSCFSIWIHRKYCPHCRNTYTLLPEILHVLKIYTLQTILNVLNFKVSFGHFTSTIDVPSGLQRIWYRQFLKRCRLKTDFPDLQEHLSKSSTLASPLCVNAIEDSANIGTSEMKHSRTHHRLNFYIHPE